MLLNAIFAVDENYGYAKNNNLPDWPGRKKDLIFFQSKTEHQVVIMGAKTWLSLPPTKRPLPNRINIVIKDNRGEIEGVECVETFSSLELSLKWCQSKELDNVYVIGGKKLIEETLRHPKFNILYLTVHHGFFECDQHLTEYEYFRHKEILDDASLTHTIYKISTNNIEEKNYLELGKKILNNGIENVCRNGITKSLFGHSLTFDLSNGFPLLTTKKMFWKGIIEEFIMSIKGITSSKYLEDKGIKIWEKNTSEDFLKSLNLPYDVGDMGPMYGYQWRHYGAAYKGSEADYTNQGVDQLFELISGIKSDPQSRRHLLTTYNPSQVKEGVLYPCHDLITQFYVRVNTLDCSMYQRSADYFLGLPFNIAETALLLTLIAHLCNLTPGKIIIHMGDVHIYQDHYDAVKSQLERIPMKFSELVINHTIDNIDDITTDNFVLQNYNKYPAIKASMKA